MHVVIGDQNVFTNYFNNYDMKLIRNSLSDTQKLDTTNLYEALLYQCNYIIKSVQNNILINSWTRLSWSVIKAGYSTKYI